MFRLSKSKVMSGLQCPKRLYLEIHHPELIQYSEGTEQAFNTGHEVGEAARRQFPQGILIDPDQALAASLSETDQQIAATKDQVLFEPTFQYDSVLVKADALVKTDGTYNLIEVKASTSVKDHYLKDIAIQRWVIGGAGYPVRHSLLWHIDNSFVYPGDGNYAGLFSEVEVTGEVERLQEQVPTWVAQCQTVLAGPVPDVAIGQQCHDPYGCPFLDHCAPEQTELPVTILPNGGKLVTALLEEGFTDLRDVPSDRLEKEKHLRVWRVTKSGEAELDHECGELLRSYPCPRFYLDFETIQFAVPIWAGTRPYEQLPFQWSCHVETESGHLEHREFLDTMGEPPMRRFAESLIDALQNTGPIFVYSSFEKTTLRNLAERFADIAPSLNAIIERLVDLLPLARAHYYHPAMMGHWSIKDVLPTIAPELAYDNDSLGEVRDGTGAQVAYREIIALDTPGERRSALISDLKNYCARDTLAMVEVVWFFEGRSRQ